MRGGKVVFLTASFCRTCFCVLEVYSFLFQSRFLFPVPLLSGLFLSDGYLFIIFLMPLMILSTPVSTISLLVARLILMYPSPAFSPYMVPGFT